jgi:CMP-N,N'-diacetyllegionaminic acid synthase
MIEDLSVLAVITARGGSKGVPGKNIRDLGGRPLIAWTIEAARNSAYIDRLILSSDSPKIVDVGKKLGCEAPFIRPSSISEDNSSSVDVLIHALDSLEESFNLIVLLQPTSPLRITADIDGCIKQCVDEKATSCVTITEPAKSPYWAVEVGEDHCLKPVFSESHLQKRRQDLPLSYVLNGAVFACQVSALRERRALITAGSVGYVMPPIRSGDIDSELDFILTDAIIRHM